MNPNFTKEMITPKLVKACREQWEKYVGKREMDDGCLICSATIDDGENRYKDCLKCPLGAGRSTNDCSCLDDSTYLSKDLGKADSRMIASAEQLKARADRLLKLYEEHGIFIEEKDKMLTVTERKEKVLTVRNLESNTPFLIPSEDNILRFKTDTGWMRTSDGAHFVKGHGIDETAEIVNADITWSRKK